MTEQDLERELARCIEQERTAMQDYRATGDPEALAGAVDWVMEYAILRAQLDELRAAQERHRPGV